MQRRLSELATAVFASGIHHRLPLGSLSTNSLFGFRKRLFIEAYGLDKHIAIILGRPPTISRLYSTWKFEPSPDDWGQQQKSGDPTLGDILDLPNSAPLQSVSDQIALAFSAHLEGLLVFMLEVEPASANNSASPQYV